MKYFVTGGCGFLGSNLASAILKKGSHVAILDNLFRAGAEQNLSWLQSQGDITYYQSDIRKYEDVADAVRREQPDIIFHVAGQVAMTTSLEKPRLDFEVNAVGTHNVLQAALEHAPDAVIIYSSTNKVYGDLEQLDYEERETRYVVPAYPNGIPESLGLDFRTPYGCSKGCADQYMLDYARCYDLKTVVFRHSSIYGGRQFSTYDQGWIGWFVKQAVDTKAGILNVPFTISGNGKQVRDVLHSDDLIACYFAASENIETTKGNAFNIGGGQSNSLSLLELFSLLERELDIELHFERLPARKSDQLSFIADVSKAKEYFDWSPQVDYKTGIRRMIEWVESI